MVGGNRWMLWRGIAVCAATVSLHAAAAATDCGPPNPRTKFFPGQPWCDTDGNLITAHGGGFYHNTEAKEWYWVGEAWEGRADNERNSRISLYSSPDLYNWAFEGYAMTTADIPVPAPAGEEWFMERPKLERDPVGGDWILYFKMMQSPGSLYRAMGVATFSGPRPTGPFKFARGVYPANNTVGDLTVYVDQNPAAPQPPPAYAVFTADLRTTAHVAVVQLTADRQDAVSTESTSIPQKREGEAVYFSPQLDGYIVWSSHTTGWKPNPASVFLAPNLTCDPSSWQDLGNPTNNDTTFNGQSTYILDLGQGNAIIAMDNWNWEGAPLNTSTYCWLPLEYTPNNHGGVNLTVTWRDSWDLSIFPPSPLPTQ